MSLSTLEPVFGTDTHPGAAERQAERDELMRIAAQSALNRSKGGQTLDPEARAWAVHWSRIKPLGRSLSSGEGRGKVE
jgi:hypothetical protein